MVDNLSVILSRIQFALTANFHFVYVPITLGLSLIIAIMETIYVRTGKEIYRDMTKFWGLLFGIEFAMGVATGIPMEFQLGTNWSYYSHYVGDIFGAPLAIEGLLAFFLEATFIGLFFFGWDRLSKVQHNIVTWLVFLGSNLSALWILIANGFMQNPVGAYFNFDTMRMELNSFSDIFLNPMAQSRFYHTLSGAYILGSVIVIAVSSIYLLKKKNIEFAKRSIEIAAIVGFCFSLLSAYSGDQQGILVYQNQPAKMAAMEAIWETESAPAGFNLFAIPDSKNKINHLEVKIPKVLGIISTHTLTKQILGINDIVEQNEGRIKNGLIAYKALGNVRAGINVEASKNIFKAHEKDLGYALLLKKYTDNILGATDDQIKIAAESTITKVWPVYFSFRIMVGIGALFILYFAVMLYMVKKDIFYTSRFMQKLSIWLLPLPWIAIFAGWFVAEFGRQPWVVYNMLPTHLGASLLPVSSVAISVAMFTIIYVVLFIINVIITKKHIINGPENQSAKELY